MRIDELLSGAPEKYRNWLEGKLTYSNELSLRQRMKALFSKFHQVLDKFTIKRKPFVDSLCNTRNYLTHYDRQLESRAAKGPDLYRLIHGLKLLLDVCLLDAYGVDPGAIPDLVSRRHMALWNRDADG